MNFEMLPAGSILFKCCGVVHEDSGVKYMESYLCPKQCIK